MGNWEHVLPYSADYAQWLGQQGYPCPLALPDNREPTTDDILWALSHYPTLRIIIDPPYLRASEDALSYVLQIEGFDWNKPTAVPKYFAMRGDAFWEIALITTRSQRCGQLVIFPDTGASSLVLDAASDPDYYAAVWTQSFAEDDDWMYIHQTLYRQV